MVKKTKYKDALFMLAAPLSLLLLGCLAYYLREVVVPSPDRLLANAYSIQRRMELRIAGAAYSPLSNLKGIKIARLDQPKALLEAESQINNRLLQQPEDAALLSSSGRAALLESSFDGSSYESAISDFLWALDSTPSSATVLNDLASAYFERAEAETAFIDYGTAFDLQSRSLLANPNDPIALFNRAITAERLYLYRQSSEDWDHYLRVDPSGPWAEEARRNLLKVRDVIDAHEHRTHQLLMTPVEIGSKVDPTDPRTWEPIDSRIEEYLSTAISDWLPAAFPRHHGEEPRCLQARIALSTLAMILKAEQGDNWLADLLRAHASPKFAQAVKALSRAIESDNVTEDYVQGRKLAVQAAQLFTQEGNQAGANRAQLEEIYALHFSDAAGDCLRKAGSLAHRLGSHRYRWMQVQLMLEQSVCMRLEGDLGKAAQLTAEAFKSASRANYPGLSLRALGFLAGDDGDEGRRREAWNRCGEALRLYWHNSVSPMPGYNLYGIMDLMAEEDQAWHLDAAIDGQAISLLPPNQNRILSAVEYTRWAHAEVMSNASQSAQKHLAIANLALAAAPQTEVTENFRVGIEVDLARIDAHQSQTEGAFNRLKALHQRITHIASWFIATTYEEAIGELQSSVGDVKSSERSFQVAVALAEQQRSSLRQESDRVAWGRRASTFYRRLVEIKLEAKDPVGALAVWELYRTAALREPRNAEILIEKSDTDSLVLTLQKALVGEMNSLDQAMPFLENRTVVVYSLLTHGLMIWAYDRRGMESHWIEKDPAYIRMLARRLSELCETPSSSISAIQTTSQLLNHILIVPIAAQIRPAATLVIEADQTLGSVPFQILLDDDGRYLIDKNPVVYSPGLRYTPRKKESAEFTTAMKALVVTTARGMQDQGLRRLADAIPEGEAVARRFQRSWLLNGGTSVSDVKTRLRNVAIFHFAGHAASRSGQTGLLLASPGPGDKTSVLDASAMEGWSLPQLRMAVLSACSTGRGDEKVSDSEGLALAFLRVGARHVIATRWDVDSGSSTAMMHAFYDALLSGRSVSQALATAENRLRHGADSHPYYWAAFDAFGED